MNLTLTFRRNGTYACPGLGTPRALALFDGIGLPAILRQSGCSDCPVFDICKMSHWTPVKLKLETDALQIAAERLGCTWQVGGQAIGYVGRTRAADYVIKVPGSPYDIAVDQQADGTCVLNTDWYRGHVAAVVGPEYGLLLQQYGIAKAEIAAHAEGYLTTLMTADNGDLQLHIEIPA